jgi:plastocyanin
MRDQVGIRPGDEVEWVFVDGALQVEPAGHGETLRGRFAHLELVKELEEDRRNERDR